MTEEWAPYLLVRPGGLPFIEEIRRDLHLGGMQVESEHVVNDWLGVSRQLYYDQYGEPGTNGMLQEGAEGWLATTVALFGNRGVLMRIGIHELLSKRLDLARQLAQYKPVYRSRRMHERQRITVTYSGTTRSWPVYFDGIHVPEPVGDRIAWELRVVERYLSFETVALALSPNEER